MSAFSDREKQLGKSRTTKQIISVVFFTFLLQGIYEEILLY